MSFELSHIAIAVPEIQEIENRLKALALQVDKRYTVPTEKVTAAMVPVAVSDDFRIELLEPLERSSPLSGFLAKHKHGGLHHISFAVSDLSHWMTTLSEAGLEILPPGIRQGARGRALFIHPRSMGGVLIELEQLD